jgi:hypothetical protein
MQTSFRESVRFISFKRRNRFFALFIRQFAHPFVFSFRHFDIGDRQNFRVLTKPAKGLSNSLVSDEKSRSGFPGNNFINPPMRFTRRIRHIRKNFVRQTNCNFHNLKPQNNFNTSDKMPVRPISAVRVSINSA